MCGAICVAIREGPEEDLQWIGALGRDLREFRIGERCASGVLPRDAHPSDDHQMIRRIERFPGIFAPDLIDRTVLGLYPKMAVGAPSVTNVGRKERGDPEERGFVHVTVKDDRLHPSSLSVSREAPFFPGEEEAFRALIFVDEKA